MNQWQVMHPLEKETDFSACIITLNILQAELRIYKMGI